ncbi:MAG: N-acetylneuraminate synthase family protein [Candidatus Thorarchaeota archaeon]|jgi:sialic acid synthase SpsE
MVEWIAEIGSNHKGSASLAYRLVKDAVQAGATIVKFQAGRDPKDPIRYADDFLPEVFQWCHSWGVEFLASCWSPAGVNLLQDLRVKRRKIAHQQSTLENVIAQTILAEELPTFVSIDPKTGSGKRFYSAKKDLSFITWLYVDANYPNFWYPIKQRYPAGWGYSDHTHGIAAALAAVAHGARTVECHFTLDPTEHTIKDNHFACTPDEFATMVKLGNEIARLGDADASNFRSAKWG